MYQFLFAVKRINSANVFKRMHLFTMKLVSSHINTQFLLVTFITAHIFLIGNPYDVVKLNENNSPLANWESVPNLTPLNLYYDVTPPELVSAVVTEVAILPCTSMNSHYKCWFRVDFIAKKTIHLIIMRYFLSVSGVPVILRIKPSEIGY